MYSSFSANVYSRASYENTLFTLYFTLKQFDNCHFTCELHLHFSTPAGWSRDTMKQIWPPIHSHMDVIFTCTHCSSRDFMHNDSKMRKETNTQRMTRKYIYVTMGDRLPFNSPFFSTSHRKWDLSVKLHLS